MAAQRLGPTCAPPRVPNCPCPCSPRGSRGNQLEEQERLRRLRCLAKTTTSNPGRGFGRRSKSSLILVHPHCACSMSPPFSRSMWHVNILINSDLILQHCRTTYVSLLVKWFCSWQPIVGAPSITLKSHSQLPFTPLNFHRGC